MPFASNPPGRRHFVCGCCATFAVAALPARTMASDDPVVVPVEMAPFHTVPTGNRFVDVISARIPPGKVGSWHRHAQDFAQIWMGVSEAETTILGEKPVRFPPRKIGQTAFASYASQPLVHNVANVGDAEFHVMGIQLKDFAPSGHMLDQRPKPYENVIDNERLVGWRLTLEPGQTAPPVRQIGLGSRDKVGGRNEIREAIRGQPLANQGIHATAEDYNLPFHAGSQRKGRNIISILDSLRNFVPRP